MPTNSRVRATLDLASALASGHPQAVAVVVIIRAPGDILLVAEPADRALLPARLREAIEEAMRGG